MSAAANNPHEAELTQLKQLAEETDDGVIRAPCAGHCEDCDGPQPISLRQMTDGELLAILAAENYNVPRAAYQVLLRKARNSEITLLGGLKLPDTSAYYLRLAGYYRPNHTGVVPRADERRDTV